MYYELIYETGERSVANYDSEEEMLSAVGEQHRKATQGEDGGPAGNRAERVVKVLAYEQHPNDGFAQLSPDVAKSQLDAALKNLTTDGLVDVMQLSEAVRDMGNPTVLPDSRHDSMFKAKEVKTFEQKEWAA